MLFILTLLLLCIGELGAKGNTKECGETRTWYIWEKDTRCAVALDREKNKGIRRKEE